MKKLLFTILIFVTTNFAADYYISPSGNDSNSGTDSATPWATFDHSMSVLQPDDILILKDGTYNQSLNVTISGTEASPITFKAENDGKAIVDGEGTKTPCDITSYSGRMHDITVEGIVFRNSDLSVILIYQGDRIILKRVSAHQSGLPQLNTSVFSTGNSTDVLYEDCSATGRGRKLFLFF